MNKIHITQLEFNKEEFDHFLAGDGEFWYSNETGELVKSKTVTDFLSDCNGRDEVELAIRESQLYASYDDFDKALDCLNNGNYDLQYLIIRNTVVMTYAEEF